MKNEARQGFRWLLDEQQQLYNRFVSGIDVSECASIHERSTGGIRAMLRRLGLIDKKGNILSPPPPFLGYRRKNSTKDTIKQRVNRNVQKQDYYVNFAETETSLSENNSLTNEEVLESLNHLFSGLIYKISKSSRDEYIVKHRLGFGNDADIPTLSELGELFNISRERVRQIEKRGIRAVCANLQRSTVYKEGVFLNAIHFGAEIDKEPAQKLFMDFLREQISSQAVRLRLGTLIYSVMIKEATSYKKAELRFIKDYRLFFEKINKKWTEQTKSWDDPKFLRKPKEIWSCICDSISWPKLENAEGLKCSDLFPQREPSDLSLGDTTSFWSKKNSRMIMAESDLERVVYDVLEIIPEVTFYIEQPIRIGYARDGKRRSYYPDIFIHTKDHGQALLEIKDKVGLVQHSTLVKALAAKDWADKNGVGFGLFCPRGLSYKKLLTTPISHPELSKKVVDEIDKRGSLGMAKMKDLCSGYCGVLSEEVLALIVQNNLALSLRPYSLSRLPDNLSFQSMLR